MNGKEKEVEVVGEVANRLLTDEGRTSLIGI